MLFSSFTFLCYFLPIVLVGYFCCPTLKVKNLFLLFASCVFYGWGGAKYLFLMLSIILIAYFGAIWIAKSRFLWIKKIKFLLFLILLFVGLFYFKYFNFGIQILKDVFDKKIDSFYVILPIGISFYTFQSVSYLIDVYRGIVLPQKSFVNLALYISMFPQLVAGPIVKYQTVSVALTSRKHTIEDVYQGMCRFIMGLSKKILIADTLAFSVDKIFATPVSELSILILWFGIIFYALQIYFDFSGYSDMAIGLGRIFGFKFLENFNYPYSSTSITEFWRRWHISLSSWFKEYVYIPLGGSFKGLKKTLRNLLVVFFLTGLWHGAEYTFLVWGLWHGFFIMFEKIISNIKLYICPWFVVRGFGKFFMWIYMSLVVLIGWVFFRSKNLDHALLYIKGLLGDINFSPDLLLGYYVPQTTFIIFIIAVILSFGYGKKVILWMDSKLFTKVLKDIYVLLLLFLSIVFLTATSYSPFIYFRF